MDFENEKPDGLSGLTDGDLPETTAPQPPGDSAQRLDEILAQTRQPAQEPLPVFPETAPEAAALLGEPAESAVPQEPEQKMHILLRILLSLIVLAMLAFAVFCVVWDVQKGASGGGFYPAGNLVEVNLIQQNKPDADPALTDADGRYTAEGIAKTVMPSIVEIYTYSEGRMIGSGSGIILTEDGFIATNAHVISGAETCTVRLYGNDEDRFTGTVIGHDTKTDLAVLKISARELPPAVLGNSDEANLGEAVCALGNPAGLNSSITTGIISGTHRKVRSDSTNFEMECIQTDAAISPGNSGGALVNYYGQVIGITSSKYSSSLLFGTSYEGLGFAITINEALPILTELMEKGFVAGRVRLGIHFVEHARAVQVFEGEIPDALKEAGIQVPELDEDSDLRNTAFEPGDWILTMNGKAVSDYDSITDAIDGVRAGESLHCRCCHVNEDGSTQLYDVDFRLLEDQSGDY